MTVASPITGADAYPLETVDVRRIVAKYRRSGLNVEEHFRDVETLTVYRCPDTGYRFFDPPVIGDADFYTELQCLPEYYPEWKWENDVAERFIDPGSQLLDVGCGEGIFLDEICSRKNCSVVGLEFNKKAAKECEKKGLVVHSATVGEMAGGWRGRFDVVTMFQVLEHIEDVRSFLDSSIELLRPGGRLIVGVPNSDPWIFGHEKYCMLNLPPHHAGLWDAASLGKIPGHFNVDLIDMIPEEATEAHLNYYSDNFFGTKRENSDQLLPRFVFGVLGRALRLAPLRDSLRKYMRRRAGSLSGHSIVAVFGKRG